MQPQPLRRRREGPVPVRAILTTIGFVLATLLALYLVREAARVLVWIVVAAFFAVALTPAVDWVQRRLFQGRKRALATLLVFLLVLVVLVGVLALFAVPLGREAARFARELPQLVDDARAGRGPIGGFLEKTHVLSYVQTHQDQLRGQASNLTSPAVGVLSGIATGVAGAVTIFVLAYLMVLEAPKIVATSLDLVPARHRDRVRGVSRQCAKAVTGYIAGNLLISVVCGLLTFVVLLVTGVPFAGLIALFVGIADLIPLVGATLGAVIAVVAALTHSVTAAIVVAVFFLAYQQLENHLLQPVVFARTVKLNPLTVIVAILVAAELAGILGALLAIPLASMVQVVARDLWSHRRGAAEVPDDDTTAAEAAS